jgi:hypothetical protein
MLSLMADTGNNRILTLVPALVEGPSPEARFAEAIAGALAESARPKSAGAGAGACSDDRLTIRLLASAALAFNKLDDDRACVATLALRDAIVAACDIDPRGEPVPLVVRDRRLALVNLLDYLDDLLGRVTTPGGRHLEDRSAVMGRAMILLAC